MTFIALMVLCLFAILCVAGMGTRATSILAGALLILQGFTIYTYASYVSARDAAPAYEQCERVYAGSDLAPILEQDHRYTLEFLGNNEWGSPQYLAHSPACAPQF